MLGYLQPVADVAFIAISMLAFVVVTSALVARPRALPPVIPTDAQRFADWEPVVPEDVVKDWRKVAPPGQRGVQLGRVVIAGPELQLAMCLLIPLLFMLFATDPLGSLALAGVLGLPLALLIRWESTGLHVAREGVSIVSMIRTDVLDWSDIDCFMLGQVRVLWSHRSRLEGVQLRTTEGETVGVPGWIRPAAGVPTHLRMSFKPKRIWAFETLCTQLNELAAAMAHRPTP
jgi:hypothetical protein